jgi:hypothetical protein
MIRIMTGIAFVGLACVATPAMADWQYTRWGMTPAQVAVASHGAATTGNGEPGERVQGQEVGATGTYASGDFKFRSVFYFDRGKLVDIRLKLIGGNQNDLRNSLDGLYGKPFKEYKGILQVATYHDEKKNNRVDLTAIGDLVTLQYRPLVDASAAGL